MGIIHICFSHSLTPRKAFFLCFPCFPCDSIKPRRGFQISSIRSIVPQELVFIKTYPFGMIKPTDLRDIWIILFENIFV